MGVSFLVGLPRSGTTLLSFLLAGTEDSLSLSEPYLAQSTFSPWRFRRLFGNIQKSCHLARITAPREGDFDNLLGYMVDLAGQSGLSRLIIKETFRSSREWHNTPLMNWIAAGPRPVTAIMRHPYDVAVSSIRFCRLWRGITGRAIRLVVRQLPLFATDRDVVEHVADNWLVFSGWCARHDVLTIRYEDLVAGPEQGLRAACERLDLPFDPRMLDPSHPRSAFGGIGDPMVMRQTGAPVKQSSVGRKKELPVEFQRVIADRCAGDMGRFGYEA